jgi:hypothetical protein
MNRWNLRNPWNLIGIVVVGLLCGALVRAPIRAIEYGGR